MSRSQYYWRQADLCMRLSLLSGDNKVAKRLGSKALELLSQAETAAAEDGSDSPGTVDQAARDKPTRHGGSGATS